jgi:hypothetical protein
LSTFMASSFRENSRNPKPVMGASKPEGSLHVSNCRVSAVKPVYRHTGTAPPVGQAPTANSPSEIPPTD